MNPNLNNETQGEIRDDEESSAQTREHPVALPGTCDVIRTFDRNTTWLATGTLGSVIFAALVLAVQERHQKAVDRTEEARQTRGYLLPNANPATLSKDVGSNEKITGEITSGRATSVDNGFTPELDHPDGQANASSWSPADRRDSA